MSTIIITHVFIFVKSYKMAYMGSISAIGLINKHDLFELLARVFGLAVASLVVYEVALDDRLS